MKYLYQLLVKPLEYVFEILFTLFYRSFNSVGISLIFMSLAVSIIALPVYLRADEIQKAEKEKQKSMEKWLMHIKKTFKKEERFFMQQAYYKEQGYRPIQSLWGSLSILIQIPIFLAAYHYLSQLELLLGRPFWIIADLGKPDGLILIGDAHINILPILMTVINCVSSLVYTWNDKFKDKWQIFVLAFVFFALLYRSPAGLVFYWTCNNLFSLVKNLVTLLCERKSQYKKYVKRVLLGVIIFVLTAITLKYMINAYPVETVYTAAFILSQIPLLVFIRKDKQKGFNADGKFFLVEKGDLTVLIVLHIPLVTISSTTTEFIRAGFVNNPLEYVLGTILVAAGMFFVWMMLFYHMMKKQGKYYFELIVFIYIISAVIHYLFFGSELGLITSDLEVINSVIFEDISYEISTVIIFVLPFIVYYIWARWKKHLYYVCLAIIVTFSILSMRPLGIIAKQMKEVGDDYQNVEKEIGIPISRTGKNVIIFMLDRAINGYLPYMLEEKPELKERFDGFTYYPNTLSYAWHTNLGAQPVFGGYEYTPERLNERKELSMKEKQTESLLMLPVLFSEEGYQVTVCDPPNAGYKGYGDLSIYNKYPDIKAMHLKGRYTQKKDVEHSAEALRRNFFIYGLFRCAPVFYQDVIYDSASYWSAEEVVHTAFTESYEVLENLINLTYITDIKKDTFLAIDNETPHNTVLLKQPKYVPAENVSGNETYAADHYHKFVENGNYHANMAAILRVTEWFEYLRENGIWDNTRIIIVADHGYPNGDFPEMMYKDRLDAEAFNPLLMFKDFDSTGFTIEDDFMTNADPPTLATQNLIDSAKNPFTGKVINMDDKYSEEGQLIVKSENYLLIEGNYIEDSEGTWYRVRDNIFDEGNWKKVQ